MHDKIRKRNRYLFVLIAASIFVTLVGQLLAQGTNGTCSLDAAQQKIFDDMNQAREGKKLNPLACDLRLNGSAASFLNDMKTRQLGSNPNTNQFYVDNGADIYVMSAQNYHANLSDILHRFKYPSGQEDYIADFVPIIARNYTPDMIVSQYLEDQQRGDQSVFKSLRMSQNVSLTTAPLLDRKYNAVGIAYTPDTRDVKTPRYQYVFIFAVVSEDVSAESVAVDNGAVLPAVYATQTAAAQATQFAPLIPTVNALLTATAGVTSPTPSS